MNWPTEQEQQEKINKWNRWYPIGTKVTSDIYPEEKNLVTRTEGVLLFKHRLAVYLEGYNGYFDLEETHPVNPVSDDDYFIKKEAKKEVPAQTTTSDESNEIKVTKKASVGVKPQTSAGDDGGESENPVPKNKSNGDTKAVAKPKPKSKVSESKDPSANRASTTKPSPTKKASSGKAKPSAKPATTENKPAAKKAATVKSKATTKTTAQAKKSTGKKSPSTTSKSTPGKKDSQKESVAAV